MKAILLATALCLFAASAAQAGGTVTVAVAPDVTMTAGGSSPAISGIDAATAAILESQIPHKKAAAPKDGGSSSSSYASPVYEAHPYAGKTVIHADQNKVAPPKRTFNPQ